MDLITVSMKSCRINLYASRRFFGSVSIKRGIFQGDSFSPLLFVLVLIPFSMALVVTGIYSDLEKEGPQINHLLSMEDLKLHAKNEDEIDALVQTVHICSADIGIEFGVIQCAVLTMKSGQLVKSCGIELPSGERVGDPESKGLGILELGEVMNKDMR